jgi:hypothetical protein
MKKVELRKTSPENPLMKALKETPDQAVNQVQNKVSAKVALAANQVTRVPGATVSVRNYQQGIRVVVTAPANTAGAAVKAYDKAVQL